MLFAATLRRAEIRTMRRNPLVTRWLRWSESKAPVLRFGLRFGSLTGIFYAAMLLPAYDRLMLPYLEANSWISGTVLNWLDQDCRVTGTTIQTATFAISVRRGCDAIEPAWFFCAAVLAAPATLRWKLAGMLIGIAALQLLNIGRIVSLFLIGNRFPQHFGTMHVEIWPVVFIVVPLVLWIWWMTWNRSNHVSTA